MMILKTTVVVKPHLPLIRFRAGGMTREVRNGRENQQSKDDNKVSGPLQWWEVPDRFRRPSKMKKDTFERFSSEKLFSVSAILAYEHAASSSEMKYTFTFFHDGRRQQAVLEKVFLTGLKKDNIRITWEHARTELKSGGAVRIDVTRLKSASLSDDWLIFGLYFFSFHNNVVNHISYLREINDGRSRPETVDKHRKGGLRRILRDSLNTDSMAINEVDIGIVNEDKYGKNTDEKTIVGQLSEIVDTPDDNYVPSFRNVDVENSREEVTNEDVYVNSLLWRSIVDEDDHLIDAEFEEALSNNGILDHLDDLSDEFDRLYGDYFTKNNFEELVDTNKDQSEKSHSSPPACKSPHSLNDSEDLDNCANVQHSIKSTPASGKGLENSQPTLGKGMMDSGFFDSFDSGSESMCDVTVETENDTTAVKNIGHVSKDTISIFFKQVLGFSLKILLSELISIF